MLHIFKPAVSTLVHCFLLLRPSGNGAGELAREIVVLFRIFCACCDGVQWDFLCWIPLPFACERLSIRELPPPECGLQKHRHRQSGLKSHCL